MGLLNWLLDRAPRPEDALPKNLITITVTSGSDLKDIRDIPQHEDDAPAGADRPENQPLENMYCLIEYCSAAGTQTRRPITMLSLETTRAVPCIIAVCHLRKALRTFRTDRIRNIITADGEVFDGRDFMTRIMGLDADLIPAFDMTQIENPRVSRQPAPQPPRTFRSEMIAPLTVLVACGKADGHFHPDEVDRVMSWAEREAMHLHRANLIDADLTLDEANALGKIIATMRPQQRTIQRHMLATLAMDADRITRFRRAIQSVIAADGTIHDKEVQFLAEFDRLAEAARRNPDHAIEEIAAAVGNPQKDQMPQVDLRKAVFIFTGNFVSLSRHQAKQMVEARNGTVKEHVNHGYPWLTGSCLVWGAGGGGGRKREDALAVGMPVITEDEFLTRMGLG